MIPRWLWALFLLALTSPFWDLGHPLIEVDDARYAEVPREMAETGDWATPQLDYLDYVEKPPLWYWLAAASYKVFGVNEAAARLPLALLALAGLLGVAWLGSWLYNLRTGLAAAVVQASASLYFFLGHYITPDMPLTVFLLWSSALILRALLRPEDGRWAGALAWACAALAFLSKGLVALIFPIGWTIALLVLFPELRRGAKSLLSPIGILAFTGIALPWFWLMEKRHPGFLRVFFIEQHFQRYLMDKYHRTSPWYFFLLVLPAGLLPWTPVSLLGAVQSLSRWRQDARGMALLIWSAMILAFFSTSHSKLATYILPALPHLALLAAKALDEPIPSWSKGFAWFLGAILAAASLAAPAFPQIGRELSGQALMLALTAVFTLGAALLVYGHKPNAVLALGLAGLSAGGLSLGAMRLSSEQLSVRSLSQAIKERYRPGDRIYSYGIYLHGVPFYTGQRVDRLVNWIGELHYAKRDPANADRFGDEHDIAALPLKDRRVFVTFRSFETPYVLSLTESDKVKQYRSFGKWALTEYSL